MKCDIIIPIWNGLDETRDCIDSIKKNTRYPYRLILVDNGSGKETKEYLDSLKDESGAIVSLLRNDTNFGFIKAVNQGLVVSSAPYICILNNDTLPAQGWLTELVSFIEDHEEVGLVNPLCNGHEARSTTINAYAGYLAASNRGKFMEMNQCQGFCMLVKGEVVEKIGYLDERFGIGGFDDTDYSMRAYLAGYRSVCVHSSYVYHREHKAFDRLGDRRSLQAAQEDEYFKKWPRHMRVAIIFSISSDTPDERISNMMRASLYLAREWCWLNILIAGDRSARDKVERVRTKMALPVHQNIKFTYFRSMLKIAEVAARILERSFGRKRRKRYDTVICDEEWLLGLIKVLCKSQGASVLSMDFSEYREDLLSKVRSSMGLDLAEAGSSKGGYGARRKSVPKCDIIIPVCDQSELTKQCIESIIKQTDTPYRLIIINNGNDKEAKEFLDGLSGSKGVQVTLIHNDQNIGWGRSINKGIELSTAPYLCLQNNDTIVTRGWLRKMIAILGSDKKFGMINPSWEGRRDGISVDEYNAGLEKSQDAWIETDWCRGFSVVVKRSVVDRIGNVDELFGLAYFDDVDYSVRAVEAGFIALKALNTYVYHIRNVTACEVLKGDEWNELHEKNKRLYYKKWGRPLKLAIILGRDSCKDAERLTPIKETAFYLARKQHHIDLFCPRKLRDKFRHTNVKLRSYPIALLQPAALVNLYMNTKKKREKRFKAVFFFGGPAGKAHYQDRFGKEFPVYSNANTEGFNSFIRDTVDRMKEETKGEIPESKNQKPKTKYQKHKLKI
ncbi:MAG: glycosyltransferase family 2 protein [Candidatus Omnitrophota bacterium]